MRRRAPRRVPLHTALPLLRLVLTPQQEAALDAEVQRLVMAGYAVSTAERRAERRMLRGEL